MPYDAAQLARRLRTLLEEPQYTTRWQSQVLSGARTGNGTVNVTAVARVCHTHVLEETHGAYDVSFDATKKRIQRLLRGEHTPSQHTMALLFDAFDFSEAHRNEITAALLILHRLEDDDATVPPNLYMELADVDDYRRLRSFSRTAQVTEHHVVGSDRRPVRHRTSQVIEATRAGVRQYPFLIDTDNTDADVTSGGVVRQRFAVPGTSVVAIVIELDRTLGPNESHAIEIELQFRYDEPPEPVFHRATLGGSTTNQDLRVQFAPDALPASVRWVERTADGELEFEEALTPAGGLVTRLVRQNLRPVVGFEWQWAG